jgi:hypothetical protein
MSRNNFWINKDGLTVGFGTHAVETAASGKYSTDGVFEEVTLKIPDMTLLGTDATAYTAGKYVHSAKIPANATVQEVWIITDTVCTTGDGADLLLGLYTISASTKALVAVDADGIAAAGDSAITDFDAAGETMVLGKGSNGAYTGKKTVGASAVVVAPIKVTGSFTAGALTVVVRYTVSPN